MSSTVYDEALQIDLTDCNNNEMMSYNEWSYLFDQIIISQYQILIKLNQQQNSGTFHPKINHGNITIIG